MMNVRSRRSAVTAGFLATFLLTFVMVCQADSEPEQKNAASSWASLPVLDFRDTISGNPLDFSGLVDYDGNPEIETDAVKEFKRTGRNPYNNDAAAIKFGGTRYSTACSGCHGHLAEGKLGPALADDYWTYPKNATDKGFFETVFGGAAGQMGPQRNRLAQDEILKIMSWIRSIYHGDPAKAEWKQ